MIKNPLLLCVAILLCITSCRKPDSNDPGSGGGSGGGGNDTTITSSPSDIIQGIVASTNEADTVNPKNFTYFNPDGTIKWKIPNIGKEFIAYDKGVFYFIHSSFDPATSTGSNGLYAVDEKTGSTLWLTKTSTILSKPIISNDTIYIAGLDKFYAFSKSGVLLWSKVISGLTPILFGPDNNVVYLMSATSSARYAFHALNLSTRNILWSASIGANPPSLTYNDKWLIILKGSGAVLALDKTNGAEAWTLNDRVYTSMIWDKSMAYLIDYGVFPNVYGYNMETKSVLWSKTYNAIKNGMYFFKDKLYLISFEERLKYLKCINPVNGDLVWKKLIPDTWLRKSVLTDKDVYFLTVANENLLTRYDAETFSPKDSFSIPGAAVEDFTVIMKSGKSY